MQLARELAPAMVGRGSGHLVFISSMSGKIANAGGSIYSATKFGMRGFAAALRAELRDQGVGVSTVFPGFIRDAGMFAEAEVKLPSGVGTRSPEDVANAVVAAIERNRGEVDVAPLGLRVATIFGGVAPEVAARVTRRVGGDAIVERLAAGQSSKR
jgi:short-subunit dehydrogenase